mmetsp:Transcript_81703/g.170979  ORF Transcript_81703/g.170979 Transcript_81703/m.170979 type:complete len:251 (+) Transcript_81703:869-1621(+)
MPPYICMLYCICCCCCGCGWGPGCCCCCGFCWTCICKCNCVCGCIGVSGWPALTTGTAATALVTSVFRMASPPSWPLDILSRQLAPPSFLELKNRGGPPVLEGVDNLLSSVLAVRPKAGLSESPLNLQSSRSPKEPFFSKEPPRPKKPPPPPPDPEGVVRLGPDLQLPSSFAESFRPMLCLEPARSRREPSSAHSAFSFSVTFFPEASSIGLVLPLCHGGVMARFFRATMVCCSACSLSLCSLSCALSLR